MSLSTLVKSKVDLGSGTTINYYHCNTGKPQIVMLHGLTDSALYWTCIANILQDQFDFILIDARGHGESFKPQKGYGYNDFVSDLDQLFQRIELREPMLVGHSIGADIAMLFVNRNPSVLVRGMILEDPPWTEVEISPTEKTEEAQEQREFLEQAKGKSIDELIAYCRLVSPNASDCDLKSWALSQQLADIEVAQWITSPYVDWRAECSKISIPSILISGDLSKDAIITPQVANEYLSLVPNGKHVHIPDAGHTIHRDQQEKFITVLQKYC